MWESCSDAAISFGGEEQEGPLAHVVENDLTVSALTEVENMFLEVEIIERRETLKSKIDLKVTQECGNVEVKYGARVKSYVIPDLQHSQQVSTFCLKVAIKVQFPPGADISGGDRVGKWRQNRVSASGRR